MKAAIALFVFAFALAGCCIGQAPDTLRQAGLEVIERFIDQYEDESESGLDLSSLYEKLSYLLEHPLNINELTKNELYELGLLTDVQARNLVDYRNKYGMFYSIYELKAIKGFSRECIMNLMPFVIVQLPVENNKVRPKGHFDMMLRYSRKLALAGAYEIPPDSIQNDKAGSFYLGDPNRYFLRARYIVKDKISAAFVADKDAGEAFFTMNKNISSQISDEAGKNYGFDFYSGHIEFKNLWNIRQLIIGDYHVRFGQGLVLWSGMSFKGGGGANGFKTYATGIRPNTSSNENMFMRGGAIRLGISKLDINIFYSRMMIDANLTYADTYNNYVVTSLGTSGYHRTLNELLDKNTLLQQHLGGHVSWSGNKFRLGMTAYGTYFDKDIVYEDNPENIFRFSGRKNINAGLNFDLLLRKTSLFGEAGFSINGGWALLAGLTHNSNNGSIFSILFREYRRNYQNFHAQAAGRRDGNANERGLKLALDIPILRKLFLKLFTDHYTYPWLTSRSVNSIHGQESVAGMEYKPSNETRIGLRYRYHNKLLKDNSNNTWIDEMGEEVKHAFRIQLRHSISPSISIKSQAEYAIVKNTFEENFPRGSLLTMDLLYRPEKIPVDITFRYALFNTDDYSVRLYAYENDVLYASSMPAYYGKGTRMYFLASLKPNRWLQCWFRFSLTTFTDRETISSGTEEIQGNKVPEIKIQIRLKL